MQGRAADNAKQYILYTIYRSVIHQMVILEINVCLCVLFCFWYKNLNKIQSAIIVQTTWSRSSRDAALSALCQHNTYIGLIAKFK